MGFMLRIEDGVMLLINHRLQNCKRVVAATNGREWEQMEQPMRESHYV